MKHQRCASRYSKLIQARREYLVKQGRASFWMPYKRNVDEAIRAAGLPVVDGGGVR
jgi:hypothetical protein